MIELQDNPGEKGYAALGVKKVREGYGVIRHTDGYAQETDGTDATKLNFLGIAQATVDNTGGSAGDLSVPYFKHDENLKFRADCKSTPVQADVGQIVDWENGTKVDETDITITAGNICFKIDKIWASDKKVDGWFVTKVA